MLVTQAELKSVLNSPSWPPVLCLEHRESADGAVLLLKIIVTLQLRIDSITAVSAL